MKLFGLHILTSRQIASIKGEVKEFAVSEADKIVIALKSTEVGAAVAANIKAISSESMTGAQKFEAVLTNTLPILLSYAVGGGVPAAIRDLEDIARALIQSVFNDVQSTSVGRVLGGLIKLLGIRK